MSRRSPPEHRGTLAGKNIIVYGNRLHSSDGEVDTWFRRQPLWALLQAFGAVSQHLDASRRDDTIPLVGNAPLSIGIVAQAAWRAVQASNDYRAPKRAIDDGYLETAFDLLHRLPDPISLSESGDRALEYMIRSGEHQITYQAELRHQMPRLLIIFTELWTAHSPTPSLDPLQDIRALTGLGLDELVLVGMALLGGAKRGLVEPFGGVLRAVDGPLRAIHTRQNIEAFVRWTSADYKTLRAGKIAAPDAARQRFAFNPLRRCPLVRADVPLPNLSRDGLLLPVWRLLYEKITFGVFHALADHHHRGPGDNPFRHAFGSVFQAYVGRILVESLGPTAVLPEWNYRSARGAADTPDWMVVDGNRLIILEVKATGLGMTARMFGDLDDLRSDLRKLARAVRQCRRFVDDVAARRPGLERLGAPTEVECVVVTFDRLFFANSVIRDELERVAAAEGVHPVPHVHLISVEDLEYLVGETSAAAMFDVLHEKRADPASDQMDFHDWLSRRFGPGRMSNPHLKRWYDDFLGRYGLPPVTAEGSP